VVKLLTGQTAVAIEQGPGGQTAVAIEQGPGGQTAVAIEQGPVDKLLSRSSKVL
jgi:hypothetical protein